MAKKAKKVKKKAQKKARNPAQSRPAAELRNLLQQFLVQIENIECLLDRVESLEQRLAAVELAVTRLPRSYPYPQPQPQSPDAPTWPHGPWSPTWQPQLPPWNGNDNVFKS